jgi:adenosylcobinamide-GDP ribazoletransferase
LKKLLLQAQTNKMATVSMDNKNKSRKGLTGTFFHPFASFLAGFRFLTIIPVSWKSKEDSLFFQSSLIWFPVIGLLIGSITSLIISLLSTVLPPSVLAVLTMVLFAGVSGCLHLDGLADSGDGLLSSRTRERSLEIMRDSHTGAMGMIAVVFVLLGKYAALSSLAGPAFLAAVFLIPMAGRTAILISMAVLPYARTGAGLGRLFYSNDSRMVAALALIFCIITTAFVSIKYVLFVVAAILLTVVFFSFWCFRKLGGATGDTLGAICELTELAVAVSMVLAPQVQ